MALTVMVACSGNQPEDGGNSEIQSSDTAIEDSSEDGSSEISSDDVPSSKEEVESKPVSSAQPVSSKVEKPASSAQPVSSKVEKPVSSAQPTSSQPPKVVESSQIPSAEAESEQPPSANWGELMDEAVVDAILAEGIEYANNKGMTWKDDYSIEDSGYYNPAFSGDGAEMFTSDLYYHIDQIYDITAKDPDYYEGCEIYYKIMKGEFKEGYWYGYVLY